MNIGRYSSLAMILILAALSLQCGKKEEVSEAPKEEAAPTATYQPTGDEGTIVGVVNFTGQPPQRRRIQMDADPVCAQRNPNALSEEVIVNNGKLQNVFVYVKSGLEKYAFSVPSEEVVLDQNGCMYRPRVLGVMAGQNVKIITSDPTNHNVHPTPKNNPEWNINQPPGSDPIIRSFPRPEVMIPVKCNQHPWMRAYIGVLRHPFHAVSKEDGSFEIKGLPPGEYEIEAWHERYGAQVAKVTVGAKETKSVEFTYAAGQAYRPGSLRLMPALTLPCCGGESARTDISKR
jgi:plastocyanin